MRLDENFLSTPVAILIGSFIISISILLSGGIIKIGKQTPTPVVAGTQAAPELTQQAPPAPTVNQDMIKALFNDKHIFFGDKNSKTLLVEFSDPSCPYCHAAAGTNPTLNSQIGPQFKLVQDGGSYVAPVPEMKKLVDSGQAAFVWVYTNGHGNGEMGTKALYCAHEKGRFWPVHDKLMTSEGYDLINNVVKNDKSKSQELANFLSSVINPNELKSCLDSGKYDSKINEDMSTAANLGISGTPGFFINTTAFRGAYSWTEMQSAIQAN